MPSDKSEKKSSSPKAPKSKEAEVVENVQKKGKKKKETEKFGVHNFRNAVAAHKGETQLGSEACVLGAAGMEDYIKRLISTAAAATDKRDEKKNTIFGTDIIEAAQVEPCVFPAYLLVDFVAPVKGRKKRDESSEQEEPEPVPKKKSKKNKEVVASA